MWNLSLYCSHAIGGNFVGFSQNNVIFSSGRNFASEGDACSFDCSAMSGSDVMLR